ncbi:MAG: ABC transporter permease [Rhizobium sp.]
MSDTIAGEHTRARRSGPWKERLALVLRIAAVRPRFALGYLIVAVVILGALLAPLLAPYDPEYADPMRFLEPPGADFLFGTDAVGMDVFSRVLYAPRIDLTIAIAATLISAVTGSLMGAWVGYFSRGNSFRTAAAGFVMRAADVLQAFPVFVFAIALVASLGQSLHTVIIAIAFVSIPIYLRLMRAQVISIRERKFIEAAEVAGISHGRIILAHIIPNALGPVLAQLSINIGWAILLAAGLSFVGAGVRPPSPEWGTMIAAGFQNVVTGQWWPSVFPGLALALTVFGFSLVGASIETFADPEKMRRLTRDVAERARRRENARKGRGSR